MVWYHRKPATVGPVYSRAPDVVSTNWHLHSPSEDKFHHRKLTFPHRDYVSRGQCLHVFFLLYGLLPSV